MAFTRAWPFAPGSTMVLPIMRLGGEWGTHARMRGAPRAGRGGVSECIVTTQCCGRTSGSIINPRPRAYGGGYGAHACAGGRMPRVVGER